MSVVLSTPLATLTPLEPPLTSRLAYDQEELLGPAVCRQVRLPRFVVVGVLDVAARSATLPPRFNLGPLSLQPPIADVFVRDATPFLGLQSPVERQRMPIPTVSPRALLASQPLTSLLDVCRRGPEQSQCAPIIHRYLPRIPAWTNPCRQPL
jgi:hypothetical protein